MRGAPKIDNKFGENRTRRKNKLSINSVRAGAERDVEEPFGSRSRIWRAMTATPSEIDCGERAAKAVKKSEIHTLSINYPLSARTFGFSFLRSDTLSGENRIGRVGDSKTIRPRREQKNEARRDAKRKRSTKFFCWVFVIRRCCVQSLPARKKIFAFTAPEEGRPRGRGAQEGAEKESDASEKRMKRTNIRIF